MVAVCGDSSNGIAPGTFCNKIAETGVTVYYRCSIIQLINISLIFHVFQLLNDETFHLCHNISDPVTKHIKTHSNGGRLFHQCKHCLHVNECLSHLSVHWAKEVERHRQLEEQSIHHHKVTNSQVTCTPYNFKLMAACDKVSKYTVFLNNKSFICS